MSWYLPPATRYPSIRSLPTGSEVDALEKATIHGEVHPVDVGGPVTDEKGNRVGHVTGRAECAGWVAALGRLGEGRHGLLDPAPVVHLLGAGAGREHVAAVGAATDASPSPGVRAQTDTVAPSSIRTSAIARPMPLVAPVTSARRPASPRSIAAPSREK